MLKEKQVFVVMQVGAKDSAERRRADEVYDFIVTPALEKYGLTPYRADLDFSPGAITPKLLNELLNSGTVIADLTGRNPNVFYELGIVHSFARPLITIADSVDSIPFDTKDERVIELGEYSESGLTYSQGETAKNSLMRSLEVILEEGYVPPSPVREVAGTQSLDALAPEDPVSAELAQIRETLEEVYGLAMTQSRPRESRSDASDIGLLRAHVERMLESGFIGQAELRFLVDQSSSPDHDSWVNSLMAQVAFRDRHEAGTLATQRRARDQSQTTDRQSKVDKASTRARRLTAEEVAGLSERDLRAARERAHRLQDERDA